MSKSSEQKNTQPAPRTRTRRENIRLYLVGMAMGAADIVPGVSGGTMAFILGIYEDLLNAIKSFNVDAVRSALKFQLKDVLQIVHWQFLLVLGAGVFTSVLTLSGILSWVLENEPVYLFSFFFGLVLASIVSIGSHIQRWKFDTITALALGSIAAYLIVGLVPVEGSHSPIILFLSGAVAIMAMILPGISGSFILLILGQYEYILNAVTELKILDLFFVAAGCGVGIIFFSRLLSWLLAHYREVVIAVLVGFMVGSLRKIWPWKKTLETAIHHGEEIVIREQNILPDFISGEFLFALVLFVFGFLLVSYLEHLQEQNNAFFKMINRLAGKTKSAPATSGQD